MSDIEIIDSSDIQISCVSCSPLMICAADSKPIITFKADGTYELAEGMDEKAALTAAALAMARPSPLSQR